MITCIICSHAEKEPILMSNLDTIESNLEISVWEMISLVTNIKLHLIDSMCSICKKCVATAKHGYYFKQQCINAKQRQVRHLHSSNKEINTNLDSDINIDDNNVFISETFITYVDNFNSYVNDNVESQGEELECKVTVEENKITNIEVDGYTLETPNDSSNKIINEIDTDVIHINDTNTQKCCHCDYECRELDELQIHVNDKHSKEKYAFPCNYCTLTFSSISMLRQHSSIHIRDKKTSSKSQKKKNFLCQHCGFHSTSEAHLLKHTLARHQSNKKSTCEECGKVCGNVHRLKKHMIYFHSENPMFKCDVCNQILSNNKGFRDHMNRHKNIQPYKCSQCPRSFSVLSSRNAHERNHHIKPDAPKIECKDCGESFTRMYSLNRHRKKKHAANSVRVVAKNNCDDVVIIDEATENFATIEEHEEVVES